MVEHHWGRYGFIDFLIIVWCSWAGMWLSREAFHYSWLLLLTGKSLPPNSPTALVNRLYSDSAALFHDFFEIMGVIDPMLAFYYVLYIIASAILERNFTMESLRVKNIAPCAYKFELRTTHWSLRGKAFLVLDIIEKANGRIVRQMKKFDTDKEIQVSSY